jgi:alpha-tubulin suppressor-like RCC1 family protein
VVRGLACGAQHMLVLDDEVRCPLPRHCALKSLPHSTRTRTHTHTHTHHTHAHVHKTPPHTKQKGRVWAAGENSDGQLGVPKAASARSPPPTMQRVSGLEGKVVGIFCGREHSGAALSDGSVLVWGFNGGGALGLGTQTTVFR